MNTEQRHTEHVVAELGELQADGAELVLGLGAKGVTARGPEVGNRSADRGVVLAGELVYVARVSNLALGRRVDAVDLARGEVLEMGQTELLGKSVDLGVLEKLIAARVDLGNRWVLLKRALARDLLREVVARVQKLEEASNGIDVLAGELNLAGLCVTCQLSFTLSKWGKRGNWRRTLPSSVNSAH